MSFTLAGLCLAISVLVLTWDRNIWCIKERIFAGLKHEDFEFVLCCFRMNVLLVIVAVFASHGRLSKLHYYNHHRHVNNDGRCVVKFCEP